MAKVGDTWRVMPRVSAGEAEFDGIICAWWRGLVVSQSWPFRFPDHAATGEALASAVCEFAGCACSKP